MSKNFYGFLIFLLVLSTGCGLLQAIINLYLGTGIYTLNFLVVWLIGTGVISVVTSAYLLKYFSYRKYWFAFYAGIAALVTSTFFLIVICYTLTSGQAVSYHMPLIYIVYCTNIYPL